MTYVWNCSNDSIRNTMCKFLGTKNEEALRIEQDYLCRCADKDTAMRDGIGYANDYQKAAIGLLHCLGYTLETTTDFLVDFDTISPMLLNPQRINNIKFPGEIEYWKCVDYWYHVYLSQPCGMNRGIYHELCYERDKHHWISGYDKYYKYLLGCQSDMEHEYMGGMLVYGKPVKIDWNKVNVGNFENAVTVAFKEWFTANNWLDESKFMSMISTHLCDLLGATSPIQQMYVHMFLMLGYSIHDIIDVSSRYIEMQSLQYSSQGSTKLPDNDTLMTEIYSMSDTDVDTDWNGDWKAYLRHTAAISSKLACAVYRADNVPKRAWISIRMHLLNEASCTVKLPSEFTMTTVLKGTADKLCYQPHEFEDFVNEYAGLAPMSTCKELGAITNLQKAYVSVMIAQRR